MMDTGYMLSFTTGLLGGFGHCIGMCGPVITSYSLYNGPRNISQPGIVSYAAGQIIFNAGRITTYSFIGALAGLAGSFVNSAGRLAGLQNIVSLLAGVVMVWMGLGIIGVLKSVSLIERRSSPVLNGVRAIIGGAGPWRFYPVGLLLGFLPCGLSYSVFIGAAGSGGMLQGMLLSLAFGLGTMPAMLLVGSVAAAAGHKLRGHIYRAGGIGVILLGGLFIIRGIRYYASL